MTALSPMLATIGTDIPRGEDWVFEPKYDGIRVLAFADAGRVALLSRNGLEKTAQFPEIADALRLLERKVKKPLVLDGEVVIMRGDTPLRFQELQNRMHVRDREAIAGHREATPAALMVFDILLDGKQSLVTEPWRVRRKHLAALLDPPGRRTNALRLSDVGEDGERMLREARRHDWEGIIAKRADAPYEVGRRSRAWMKLKLERRQEFVVGGWTEPRKSREHIGALLLGYYDANGELVYAGHTGTGFTRKGLAAMYKRLAQLERKTSPFATPPKTNEAAHWTRPVVVVEIKFNEWTDDGRLRQPVFLGVRDDKPARSVVREKASVVERVPESGRVRAPTRRRVAASVAKTRRSRVSKPIGRAPRRRPTRETRAPAISPKTAERLAERLTEIEGDGGSGVLELPDGRLELSNLGKIYFPKTGHTKGDLLRYYARVAPYLIPAIADRPLVMKRFPNGVSGKAFYQQKAPTDVPAGVRVEAVSDEGLTTANRLIGGDLATLLYVVQLGAISIDPWHSRVGSVAYADYSIIDLDPGPRAPFARVVEVALEVKRVLDELGLHAVPKTSGASGLHVVLPLARGVPNDGARMIAELVATRVAERMPKIATVERWVKSRAAGAVYVDFLQNIRGKTVASVYSVRARPAPTVSTPLDWDEVNAALDPRAFTVDTVLSRLDELGDLWSEGMHTPNTLDGIGKRG